MHSDRRTERGTPAGRRFPFPSARSILRLALLAAIHTAAVRAAPASASASAPEDDAEPAATAASLPPVTVTAETSTASRPYLRAKVANGALGSRSQLDTPFSTTVVTADDLADRQPIKLGDVFEGDAAVSDNSNAYSAWATYITIRGLPIDWQNGFCIDGMPFISYGITMPYEQLERIELLKGSSGFMYGFGAPGGLVNYVTKKPGAEPVTSLEAGYHMDGAFAEHVDLGRRFGPGGGLGARLNATHEEGDTYDGGGLRRNSASLALDARLGPDLSVFLDALYQDRLTSGQIPAIYTGAYAAAVLPRPIDGGSDRLAGRDQHLGTNLQLYSGGARYRFAPDWTFSTSASYGSSTRDRNESSLRLLNAAGDYADDRWIGDEAHRDLYWQSLFEGAARTGPFAHHLVAGASWQRQTNDYSAVSYYAGLGGGNLHEPNPYRSFSPGGLATYRAGEIEQKALFASDTIDLTDRWSLLAGERRTDYGQRAYAAPGALASPYRQNGVLTPTVALMYKPEAAATAYASYVESLEPGATVDSLYANGGALLRPLRSRQYEIGVKSDRSAWSANAALFRIERGAAYANAENVYVQDGTSIYQGLEAGAGVHPGHGWEAAADLMLLDARYAHGQAYDGNRVAGAPRFSASARVAYDVPFAPGLQLGVDAKYTGRTALRPAGDLKVGGHLLANLGASYRTRLGGHDATLHATIANLADRRYWMYQYADYIAPGDPRTVSLDAKIDF